MNRALLLGMLLMVASLVSGVVHAQARGPSAEEILQNGQDILSGREVRQAAAQQAREQALQKAEEERQELLDPAVRARRLEELDTWFRRIPGRFRIEGQIESLQYVFEAQTYTRVGDKVTGVADCTGIGEGVGVQCILTATWRTIEINMPAFIPPAPPPPPSEMLRTFSPAVLVLGWNLDPPGIRAQMVNADSLSHTWAGQLKETTATANRLNRSLPARNIQQLQIIAEPDSEVLTVILHAGAITLTLTMYPDAEARVEKPIKTLKVR